MTQKSDLDKVGRCVALLLALAAPLLLLVLITRVAGAQGGDPPGQQPVEILRGDGVGSLEPASPCVPQNVTCIQTATLLPPADPLADLVPTVWENDWRNFDRSMYLVYPDDVISSEVSVIVDPPTVTWEVVEELNQFRFYAPPSQTYDVFMVYTTTAGLVYTDAEETRLEFNTHRFENESRLQGHIGGWLTTGYFRFTSTLFFPSPYEFIWATAIPTDILTYTLEPGAAPHWIQWALQDVVSFRGMVQIRDTRLHSDLVIEDFYIEPTGPVTAGLPVTVTAVILNQGEVMPETYFYTEWYARPPEWGQPVYPNDHDYGWCGDLGDCADGRYEFIFDADPSTLDHPLPAFPDPVLSLIPGQSVVLTRVYAFPTAGDYELWAQVDVDVQHDAPPTCGPNLESDEGNNVAGPLSLTITPTDWSIYLPLVMRNY